MNKHAFQRFILDLRPATYKSARYRVGHVKLSSQPDATLNIIPTSSNVPYYILSSPGTRLYTFFKPTAVTGVLLVAVTFATQTRWSRRI